MKTSMTQDAPVVYWKDVPELASLCWNRHTSVLSELKALQLYESNWAFIDKKNDIPRKKFRSPSR